MHTYIHTYIHTHIHTQISEVRAVLEQHNFNDIQNSHIETVVILNKADLLKSTPNAGTPADADLLNGTPNEGVPPGPSHLEKQAKSWLGENIRVHLGSCLTGLGVDGAVATLHAAATRRLNTSDLGTSVLITRPRHRMHLELCAAALDKFCALSGSPDVLAEELREAVGQIGAITGRVHVEQVLDVLFADFCIGK
jgi:tRNA U34 5-carboxymethylaminomethyl modifying GTPase MnmE/TrmE